MTTTDQLAELLKIAKEAAAAGAAVLAERSQIAPAGIMLTQAESGVDTKSSESDFVTDFDKRAEDAVRAVVTAHRPHDAITGEEYGTTSVENPTGYRWSIDPLDGTTNFLRGIVYYGTSVGLQGPDGEWLVGVVDAPALRRLWWGVHGEGAYTTAYGHVTPVRLSGPTGELSAGLLATGFGYDPQRRQQQSKAVMAMLDHFGNLRRCGAAAIDLCMVADGTIDAYAEYGIKEHDWAAGALIAAEAGAPVRRPDHGQDGGSADWCVAGDIGIQHRELLPTPRGL